jgi:hypothetical protein
MISEDGKFTESKIKLADELLEYSWNNSVTDFLHVIAGIAHAAPLAHLHCTTLRKQCGASVVPAGLRTGGTKPPGRGGCLWGKPRSSYVQVRKILA